MWKTTAKLRWFLGVTFRPPFDQNNESIPGPHAMMTERRLRTGLQFGFASFATAPTITDVYRIVSCSTIAG
ncbi:hypothetical protein RESH_05232 [Rhodopirellula europaea SH398]|uniref:Uncharacterized protein n=1 Tax=Rhodopirellula europaea SH398 TaxID=1263868 RepID=M5S958_9BACT|nr:hypothetical protein RESH_05232 [Rhodopirellula europaea SH398]